MAKGAPVGSAAEAQSELRRLADPKRAALVARFFQTGPGQYAEGDRFLGLTVPQVRTVARRYREMPLPEVRKLVRSPWHEERLLGLVLWTLQAAKATPPVLERIARAYLTERGHINNWDLVDVSAPLVLGAWLEKGDRSPLLTLARSSSLWDRRIAIVTTFHFIRRRDFDWTLRLARLLLNDPHPLLHKATGWMLREVEKRSPEVARAFLRRHAARMPRTMLRYAIERMPAAERLAFMAAGRPRP